MINSSSGEYMERETNAFPGFGEILLYLQIPDEL